MPPPLPPAVELDAALVRALSAADQSVGELRGVARSLPNLLLLSQPLVRREAVLSSRIEGTQASLSELVLFEVDQSGSHTPDVQEVLNYVRASEHALDPTKRLPLSLPLLAEVHEVLLRGVRGEYATPGEFRRSQNWIGAPGATLVDARYVPPPPERLWECLDAFEKYLYQPRSLPPLLDIAAIHYQFEAIHPFLDGNGRVGRLLILMLMVEWDILPGPVLDLSAHIEPRRQEYYDALFNVSARADWHGWFMFMLEVFEVQARNSVKRARRLVAARDDYRARVSTTRSSALLPRLVDELFTVPALSIPHARDVLGVSHRSASLSVRRLVELDILHEVPTTGRRHLFIAPELVAIAEGRHDH